MAKKKPQLNKLQALVDHNNDVFLIWIDGLTSGTLTLTAEEAVEIGRIGKMAGLRRDGFETFMKKIGKDTENGVG